MQLSLKSLLGAAAVAVVGFGPITVSAGTVTSNSFTNTATYDFSTGPSVATNGPEVRAIGGQNFTFTSTYSSSVFDYASSYGLDANGSWGSGRNGYAGLNAKTGTMTFSFDTLVGAVGGFVNYALPSSRYPDAVLEIFGVGNVLLESFNLNAQAPISTPGATDDGAFRGFQRASADISSFALTGAYVVIDDLVIGDASNISPVPVPATAPLLLAALGVFGFVSRRRKRA